MADENEIEQAETESVEDFHVNLEPNNSGSVPVASDDEEADDVAETEAGDTPETAAAAAEEQATPPTAEELGVDTSTPEGKKQFKALLAKWNQWYNRHSAKLKAHAEQPAQPAPASTETPAQAGEAWDPYTVPLDKFVYDGGKESDDSVLSGAEADIDRRIQKGVAEGIKFALNEMRQNDARLRQQAQIGTAQERIAAYAEALQAHPEWDEKAPLVAKIAAGTKDLAINDPDEWIAMVEARTGIARNWREDAKADDAAASTQRAQQNQRLAAKPRSSVARPTNGSATLAGPPRGDLSFDRAFDAAWQGARR